MRLQYLGTAAAEGIPALFCTCETCRRSRAIGGRAIRTRSQAIIDGTLLIDLPADTYLHFLVHEVPLATVQACLITHSHPDHLYPADLWMRKNGFSHLPSGTPPFTVYADESGYAMVEELITRHQIQETDLLVKKATPTVPFTVAGYTVTPLRASHSPETSPVVYIVEKEGKSLLYSHDSSEYNSETMAYLAALSRPLDLVSLDCTEACNHKTYIGHLDFERCIAVRKELIACGAATDKTVFVLNHFSHNGADVVYDDFIKIADEYGFLVSYDGMVIDI